jgi:hypothetical protein
MVKSSTPAMVRYKMYELVNLVMKADEQEVQDFIANFREEFKSWPVEEICFPRGVNGIKEYSDPVTLYKKGTPIHVKGAILYNDMLNKLNLTKKYEAIKNGEKLKFTYLKQPNPMKDSVISFPSRLPKEFGMEKYVDYDMQFEKCFMEPIKIILDCIGWQTEKRNSLDDFFG